MNQDITVKVLAHLGRPAAVVISSQVCRQWRQAILSPAVWKPLATTARLLAAHHAVVPRPTAPYSTSVRTPIPDSHEFYACVPQVHGPSMYMDLLHSSLHELEGAELPDGAPNTAIWGAPQARSTVMQVAIILQEVVCRSADSQAPAAPLSKPSSPSIEPLLHFTHACLHCECARCQRQCVSYDRLARLLHV